MKFELEVVRFNVQDVITTSECCEWGCPTDMDQAAGNY